MIQNITDINELLNREAALSAQQLGIGLTSIRKYNFGSKGIFYSGMFSLTIGLERILKLIILLDYYIKNNEYPKDNYLKQKGHKIEKLIEECNSINNERTSNKHNYPSNPITKKIISFLSDFAIGSRYYNLDVITGSTPKVNEPLARWDNEICSIILEKHPPSKKKLDKYKEVADKIHNISIVSHTLDDGTQINDTHTFFEQSAFIEEKQGWSVYYLYMIIQYSVHVLKKLDYELEHQLYLREHFLNLAMASPTSAAIRKRKNWTSI